MKQRYTSSLFKLLFVLTLSSCAALKQYKSPPSPSPDYTYLEAFINKNQAENMLKTEPLQSQIKALLKDKAPAFTYSRQQLKPITQIMQGYILSEGQSNDGNKRSLVLVDPDRNVLMLALVDVSTRKIDILKKASNQQQQEAIAEMKEYAQDWSRGQLGEAQ